jgi:hypothetical protein
LYGIKTTDGNVLLEPQFSGISPYDNGIAIVSNQEYQYGTVDLQGGVVVPLIYDALNYNSSDNTFIFSKNGKSGILTGDNQIMIPL